MDDIVSDSMSAYDDEKMQKFKCIKMIHYRGLVGWS